MYPMLCVLEFVGILYQIWRKHVLQIKEAKRLKREAEMKEKQEYEAFLKAVGTRAIEPGLQGSSTARLEKLLGRQSKLPLGPSMIERAEYHVQLVDKMKKRRKIANKKRSELWT